MTKTNKIAILCASGLGDGILMMTAYENCRRQGHDVTLFHEKHQLVKQLFPQAQIQPFPESLNPFDLIILENDHSARAWDLFRLRNAGLLPQLITLFPTPSSEALPQDFVFKKNVPVLDQIAESMHQLLHCKKSTDNGIEHTGQRKQTQCITIHPTSADPKRNWPQKKFLKLAKKLKKMGFKPCFALAEYERAGWENFPFPVHTFPTLKELAVHLEKSALFIGNDSGLGHLASSLGTPTVTISGNPKRVASWRPAWSLGTVATLPFHLPNFKGLTLRDRYWKKCLTVKRVLDSAQTLFSSGETLKTTQT